MIVGARERVRNSRYSVQWILEFGIRVCVRLGVKLHPFQSFNLSERSSRGFAAVVELHRLGPDASRWYRKMAAKIFYEYLSYICEIGDGRVEIEVQDYADG